MRRLLPIAGLAVAFGAALVVGLFVFGNEAEPEAFAVADAPLEYEIDRDPDVPALPFDDNPDPSQCGIPVQWGDVNNTAWLSGLWQDELIQPEVLVYDSHLRVSVTGGAPHGTQVEIILFQENPVLDYYFVKIPGETPQEGWVPEPFLSFEPVA